MSSSSSSSAAPGKTCPNLANPFHECTDWCSTHWGADISLSYAKRNSIAAEALGTKPRRGNATRKKDEEDEDLISWLQVCLTFHYFL
tara:strand:- start:46 stop:306 length:261 start_codon:yes stop_codon:yes gene_type:complete